MDGHTANFSTILYEKIGPVARILHNRPAQRNAENKELLQEMDDAFTEAERDPEVRVVILGGVGDHFSAGHDLKEGMVATDRNTTEGRWAWEERYYIGYSMRIHDFPKPTIAQVQGACIAGGFMVANMCDLMVVADDAFFSDPVVHTLTAASVEVLIHPWVMGMRKAKELLYTGRRLGAQEAFDMGLANRLVPRVELEAATLELANQIAEAPPFAIKMTKRSLNRTWDIMGLRNAIQAHFDTHELTHTTDEFHRMRAGGSAQALKHGKSAASGKE